MTFYDDKAYTINDLIEAVIAIEDELGPLPAGVYASVRTRLDILEARINQPFTGYPNVTNPFYIGGSPVSGVSIQDGYGDPNVRGVLAVPGSLYLREDGYNIQGLYTFRPDGYWHQIDTDAWTAAGDLAGTIYSQTVIGLQGRPINPAAPQIDAAGDGYVLTWGVDGKWEPQIGFYAAGDLSGNKLRQTLTSIQGNAVLAPAPLTYNTLGWTGTAWEATAVNLAGGLNSVVNQLPPANMGTITLNGDVAGANAGGTIPTTVLKINGVAVEALPSINEVLVATSGTTSVWQLIIDNQVSPSAGIQGTKVVPSFGSQNIITTGSASANGLISTGTITFTTTDTTPNLFQVDNTTNSATAQSLTVQAQNATGTTSVGGALNLTSGTGTSTNGAVNLQVGGTTTASLVTNKFVFSKGRRRNITPVTGAYGVLATDDYLSVNTISSTYTITLPASPTTGDAYEIKDTNGNLSGTVNLIINGNGNNIDGTSTRTLTQPYTALVVTYTGSQWSIS
jgi:hypothetical protein